MNGFVNISPEELIRVSVIYLEQHQNYNGEDDKCVDRDIHLSLTMYSELYNMLNKSENFQPYIFGDCK